MEKVGEVFHDSIHEFVADVSALVLRVNQNVVQECDGGAVVKGTQQADQPVSIQAKMTCVELRIAVTSLLGYLPYSQPTERKSRLRSSSVKSLVCLYSIVIVIFPVYFSVHCRSDEK